MSIVEFSVDTNEYYQGFVKSTSMRPFEAIKELSQNIKNYLDGIYFHVKCFDESDDLIKIDKIKNYHCTIKYVKTIVLDDNSSKPMTPENATNMMKSLMITKKEFGGPGCFNFGEILGMHVLTSGNGIVIYYNKSNKSSWILEYKENKCPSLNLNSNKYDNIIKQYLSYSDINDEGTIKIIIRDECSDIHYQYDTFSNMSTYLDFKINGDKYDKWSENKSIPLIIESDYKFKFKSTYYINKDSNNINLTKYDKGGYYAVDNVSPNARAQSSQKSFKPIDKSIGKRRKKLCQCKLDILSILIPYEHHDDFEEKLDYIVCDFKIDVKKPDDIIKLIYPNSGGNHSCKHTYTYIILSSLKPDDDVWIKKNIFNFYPDKIKTGDPIVNWKYIQNYIKKDLNTYYTHISSDTFTSIPDCFAVRNKYVPGLDNNMYEYVPSRRVDGKKVDSSYKKYEIKQDPNIEESSDSSDEENTYEEVDTFNKNKDDKNKDNKEYDIKIDNDNNSKDLSKKEINDLKLKLTNFINDDNDINRITSLLKYY